MFTGLVLGVGKILAVNRSSHEHTLEISCDCIDLDTVKNGDSIAVDGVCLTFTGKTSRSFYVLTSSETISRTISKHYRTGINVNLELPIKVGDRIDGHIVQGHVDAQGKVVKAVKTGKSLDLNIRTHDESRKYIVDKGSITVNGVSLTVNAVEDRGTYVEFSLKIVPHTQTITTLPKLKVGDIVNLETDILWRYIERLFNKKEKKSNIYDSFKRSPYSDINL